MSAVEVYPLPQSEPSRAEQTAAFVGRQLQRMIEPVAERLEGNRFNQAAAVCLSAVALWAAMESTAGAAERELPAPSVLTRTHGAIGGSEVVVPSPSPPAANAECGDPDYRAPKQTQIDSMLCRFNNARAVPLVEDSDLDAAAQAKLDEILTYRHISHWPRSGEEDPLQSIKDVKGVEGTWVMGEDLAYGLGDVGKARSTFAGWRWSPPHWRNIINERFTNVGFAVRHLKRIVVDVDYENGYTFKSMVLRNVTLWAAEFWGR